MTLKALYNSFAIRKEANWIMKPQNAQLLYLFVKRHNIKRVLDLGTGIGVSAAVIALALKDKGETDYHIDSMEQDEKCIAIANDFIPDELKTNLTIHHAQPVIWENSATPFRYFSIFESLPEGPYDLIINDGPGPFLKDGVLVDIPNGTVTKMLLEEKIPKGTYVLWDGRIAMLGILERYYGDNFYLVNPADQADLTVLERKEGAVVFRDELYDAMKSLGYFDAYKKTNIDTNNGTSTLSAPTITDTGAPPTV